MKTNESIFDIFLKEICSNCKKDKYCQEELRRRLDNTVKCYEYEKVEEKEEYKKKTKVTVTAKKNKPIMKGIIK